MLDVIREELNELAGANMDKLTKKEIVSKSQELDIYVNEAMYKQIEAAKKKRA